jgi:hypothetical protein
MLLIRRLLQIAFGFVLFAVLSAMVKSPKIDFVTDAVLIGFPVSIILVLGPLWPSPDKAGNWDWALKLNLPTDDPKIAAPLAGVALGIYSLFHAWEHTQPNPPQFHRFERLIGLFSSHEGIALVWVAIGVGCFVGAWQAFGRIQTKPKDVR